MEKVRSMPSRPPRKVSRRTLLRTTSAAALAAIAGCPTKGRDVSCCGGPSSASGPSGADSTDQRLAAATRKGVRLLPDPSGLLELPAGFSYRVLQRFGDPLSDGYRVAGRPDGMGAFAAPDGSIVLMRNHELTASHQDAAPYTPEQGAPPEAHDPNGTGGVTRLVVDPETLAVRSSNLVLAGTYWNCAGGLSPWGWLSCEETVEANHGYVFLCPSDASRVVPARPIRGYGRFRHEAASVDPATLIAYLTEDQNDGCFYRFVPHAKDKPFEGKLQALRTMGEPGFDTSPLVPGNALPIDWVDVPNPDPEDDSVRFQAQAAGAAIFRRVEGLWLAPDAAYFCATTGGPIGHGQIFRLRFGERPLLDVIAASTDPEVLDNPDNICVSPQGQLWVAEDSLDGNLLRKVTLDGQIQPFARNARSSGEFAGPCFSPDGRTLFVNMQEDQLTLAIRGPFDQPLPLSDIETASTDTRTGRMIGGSAGLALLALAAFAARRSRR
jgi:MYXO-CTERM domain-containing protein